MNLVTSRCAALAAASYAPSRRSRESLFATLRCAGPPSLPGRRGSFQADDPDIARGVAWFLDNQEPNGLWNTGRNRRKGPHSDLWVGLAICRMLNAINA